MDTHPSALEDTPIGSTGSSVFHESSLTPSEEAGWEWSPGDPVAVYADGRLLYHGVIDVFAGALGVAWVREVGDGWRRMVSLAEVQLHRP